MSEEEKKIAEENAKEAKEEAERSARHAELNKKIKKIVLWINLPFLFIDQFFKTVHSSPTSLAGLSNFWKTRFRDKF